MAGRWLLGLDLGGGGARALVADPETGATAVAARPLRAAPRPGLPTSAEFDAHEVWSALGEATREALAAAGTTPEALAGIAATSMRHGTALLDVDGRELLLASNRDARGMAAMLELAGTRGAEVQQRTGRWPNPVQAAGRLRWVAREAPALAARVESALALSEWLAARLCGVRAGDATQAGESLLFELESAQWAADLIEDLGIPRRWLPPIRAAGSRLGELAPAAAEALGLRAGTPVAVGGADTQLALLAIGAIAPGSLAAVVGTSAPVLQVQERAQLDPSGRLWTVQHALAGRFALESNAGGMGEALEWIAGLLFPDARHPVLHLLSEAAGSPPGAAGFVSSLGAGVMDARQVALPIGDLTASPIGTAGDPDRRRHLARCVLEGMACALRANVEQIEAVSGSRSEALQLAGGMSRSALFAEIVCDVLGRPVTVPATPASSALGAAICAGVGAGIFADLAEGAAALGSAAARREPSPGRSAVYADLYAGWCELGAARAASRAPATALAMRGLASRSATRDAGGAAAAFRPRILVTADLDESALELLRAQGEVEHASYRRTMRLLTGPSLAAALRGVHVLVTEVDLVDAAALVEAPDLRLVVACRGDAVNVDLAACRALGIPVLHTPGRNADAVADLTLAFLLALARRLVAANGFLREPGEAGDLGRMGRAFQGLQGRELWRKTIGLVGFGAVGRKVVERLHPFGARCLVHDPHVDPDAVRLAGAEPVALDRLLAESEFVSLHAALGDASRGLLGARELARMRRGSFLVNTARAALVDEAALREALVSGHLAGAALDVFWVEPPASDDPLLALEQVIATPHVGGNTAEVAAHQGRIAAGELALVLRGEPPLHCLDPEALAGFDLARPRPAPTARLRARLARGPAPAVNDLERERAAAPGAPKAAPAPPHPPAGAAGPDAPASHPARSGMERLLGDFVARARADEALARFAASGQTATLCFTLTDLGIEFHLGFADGRVHASLGAPTGAGAVQLKMRAEILDGMLSGRRNAMEAALGGELSFSGDTARAMALQHVQRDLARLYAAAREAAGDPGDLSAGTDPMPAGAPDPTSASQSDTELRQEIVAVVHELYAARLITATGGNVSARSHRRDEAWITPSRLFKGDLRPEILVRIDMQARPLEPGARSPSSEALMHTAVLCARAEANAVIHCHAPYATILVNAGLPFLPISTEAAFFSKIGRIPFVMPGTEELARAVVEAMADGWAVLMQNHGLLVAGRTLRRAADMAEIIERTAEVIVGCHAVGRDPPVLPDEAVQALARYGDLLA